MSKVGWFVYVATMTVFCAIVVMLVFPVSVASGVLLGVVVGLGAGLLAPRPMIR